MPLEQEDDFEYPGAEKENSENEKPESPDLQAIEDENLQKQIDAINVKIQSKNNVISALQL